MALTAVSVTTAVTPIVAAPTNGVALKPRFIHIANTSTSVTVFVKYDDSTTTLTASNGIPIYPQQKLNLDNDGNKYTFQQGIQGITSSGTADVRVQY